MTPSEQARIVASVVREEDLQEMEEFHRKLQERIDQARDDGRLYIMGQWVRLQAMLSAEIDRVQRRFARETLAANRREHKRLKQEAKEAAESAQ